MTALTARGLCHKYGGVTALLDVDVTVAAGEVVGLIGANGSGKSTLVNVLTGHLRTEGTVLVAGRDVTGASPQTFARQGISRTFQSTRLLEPLSALDNVKVGLHRGGGWRRRRSREAANKALATVGLGDLSGVRVSILSHGQRRRVELARAIVGSPAVLILDEPTAGLFPTDVKEIAQLIAEIASRGAAVLMVEHDLAVVARICSRVLVIDSGVIVDDGPTTRVLSGAAIARLLPDVTAGPMQDVAG